MRRLACSFALLLTVAGCSLLDGVREEFAFVYTFDNLSLEGWTAGLADYPVGDAPEDYAFVAEPRALPPDVGSATGGAFVASTNHSDDLFTFLKRRERGLVPGATYDVHIIVRLASDAPSGCVGAGGAPGESVYLKIGVLDREPRAVTSGDMVRMNVDIGNQSTGGATVQVVGDVANGAACENGAAFRPIVRRTADPIRITANEAGEAWLLVGTDSGFEGRTSLYYDQIAVNFVGRPE